MIKKTLVALFAATAIGLVASYAINRTINK